MEESSKISRKLERLLQSPEEDPEQIVKYMERMAEVDMTLSILTKTGIGLIINKFRKRYSEDASVTAQAKHLIKQWKKLVPKDPKVASLQQQQQHHKRPRQAQGDSEDASPSLRDGASEAGELSGAEEDSAAAGNTRASYSSYGGVQGGDSKRQRLQEDSAGGGDSSKVAVSKHMSSSVNQNTTDSSRLKARDMIYRALSSGDIPNGAFSADYLAMSIETAIFNVFMNNGANYKQRVRTRVMNLKDKNNEELRLNVLVGSISAEKLAVMSSEDMASKDMKELRSKFLSEVIHEAQLTECVTATDGVVQCRRCKKYKVSYNQAQTRSADEPMTTFAFCHTCGHRWKFC